MLELVLNMNIMCAVSTAANFWQPSTIKLEVYCANSDSLNLLVRCFHFTSKYGKELQRQKLDRWRSQQTDRGISNLRPKLEVDQLLFAWP